MKKTIPARININVGGKPLSLSMDLPSRDVRLRELLPIIQKIDHKVIDVAVEQVAVKGEHISCAKGCGACCKQLVPITQTETWYLADLIKRLPKEKQKRIRQRFAKAEQRIKDAGFWEVFSNTAEVEDNRSLGFDYFDLGIECPFLEEGACSIHPNRPLSCREFLATSAPEYCRTPRKMKIVSIDIPSRLSNALGKIESEQGDFVWVPLTLALAWTQTQIESPKKPAQVWMESFFKAL